MNKGLVIAAFAALGLIGLAGWARKPMVQPYGNQFAAPGMYGQQAQPVQYQYDAYGRPVPVAQPYNQAGVPCVAPAGQALPVQPVYNVAPAYAYPYGATAAAPVQYVRTVRQPTRVVERRYVEDRRGRSTGKSIAIVAGSAGVGSAIGALTGGGKGAAIGALTGGAAGFIYDRLTHNR